MKMSITARVERFQETVKERLPEQEWVYLVVPVVCTVLMAFGLIAMPFAYDLPVMVWVALYTTSLVTLMAFWSACAGLYEEKFTEHMALPKPTDTYDHGRGLAYRGWEVEYGPYFVSVYVPGVVQLAVDGKKGPAMSSASTKELALALLAASSLKSIDSVPVDES